MVFLWFGADPSSWAMGNDMFALANNLPPGLQSIWDTLGEPFEDKSMAGTAIKWMSATPSGNYAIMTHSGTFYTNITELLDTVVAHIHDFVHVEYVSLSELGGWFIRFSDSSIIISGEWNELFLNLASTRLDRYNRAKQVSIVQRVFSLGEVSLVKTSAAVHWDGIPQAMADAITHFTAGVASSESMEVGANTFLCPWSNEYWFLEAVPAYMGTTRYLHRLPTGMFDPELINCLITRRRAPPHLIPQTSRAGSRPVPAAPMPPPPPRPEAQPTYQPQTPLPPPPPRQDTQPAYQPQYQPQSPLAPPPPGQPTYHRQPQSPPSPRPPSQPTYQPQPQAPLPPPPPPRSESQPSYPYQPPAPNPTPPTPSRSTNPFRTDNAPSHSTISESDRRRFGEQFDQHARGGTFINGTEAAVILLESGLDTRTLADIWEIIDVDKNGKLDKEEFVAAMWHVESRQNGSAAPVRHTQGHITCDGCSRGLAIGEEIYYCSVCNGGDFDLCATCHFDYTKRCHHQLKKLVVELEKPAPPREIPGDCVVCDGCAAQVYKGSSVYCCNACNNGDYDICENCWKVQNVCGHSLDIRQVVSTVSDTSQYRYDFNSSTAQIPDNPSDMDKLSKQFNDTKLKDSLMSSIITEKPNVKWDDVAGLEAAKDELQEAIIFPGRFPHLFKGKRKPRRAILLYGPPGTGKSYLAKAVATEVDHTLFSISSGDLMSKWMGESEGLMRQLFTLAREKKPSIIFIDEIDALCGNRDSGAANAEDTARLKTEFLVQMDGLGNDNDGVFFLAATNLPWSLDPAVRRRFQKRIHVPLPDDKARQELFQIHLGDMAASFGDPRWAFADLVMRTNGFSGSDVANVVQDALMLPIKRIHTATHFKKIHDQEGEWFTPCDPNDRGAMPMKWNQVPGRQLKEPPLVIRDLFAAVQKVKPSVGPEEIRKCNEWTQQYGMEG